MSCLHKAWSWLLEWWPYGVYELSNFLLIIFGIWLSFEGFAKKVETNRRYKRALAVLCFLLGGIGMYLDAIARHDSDKSGKQVIADLEVNLKEMHELLTKTDSLVTNTNTLVTFTTVALPKLAELQSRVASLRTDIVTAERERNPVAVADLKAKVQETQQQADRISHELQVLAQAANIVDQLGNWQDERDYKMETINGNETSEYSQYRVSHPNDEQGIDLITRKYQEVFRNASEQDDQDLRTLVASADSVRKELLQWVPNQTPLDKTMEQQFVQGRQNLGFVDTRKAAAYIEDLVKRVPPPQ